MDVIVADDSEVTRRILASTIERCGHRVISAEDGGAAWTAFQRDRPPLVVLDWRMPELDGLEVTRRIRGAPGGIDVFILMITGRDTITGLLDALTAGVDDYMTKPVVPSDLEARLLIAQRRIEQTRERREVEEALVRAERMVGVGEIALALQHEINNPLMALLTHAQLLSEDKSTPAAIREQAKAILDQTRRIADVVSRLRTLRDAKSVEYVNGSRMTDLGARSRGEPVGETPQ
jgi:DNA-binding response OmpR family regulator